MKRSLFLLTLAFALLAVSCQTMSSHGGNPLLGNWEFVSGRYTTADGKVTDAAPPDLQSLKIVGPARFSYITVKGDGSFVRASGGRYEITGNRYTEYIDKSSAEARRGKAYSFEWRVEGDTWYHAGTNEGVKFEEVWKRAK